MNTFKYYRNRKLYDTKQSRYVTLDYIIDLVKQDSPVEVISHDTGLDVTSETLKQALMLMNVEADALVVVIKDNDRKLV